MHISAKPHSAKLFQDSQGECFLHFTCTALADSGILEINNKYIFAGKNNTRIFERRSSCELEVRVKRRSFLSETAIVNLKLSENKVGELSFCPPMKADRSIQASKAVLDASVFVSDKLFDNVMSTLLLGRRPAYLQLELDSEGALRYGWEPDGSRIEWKIPDSSSVAEVDIENLSLTFELIV